MPLNTKPERIMANHRIVDADALRARRLLRTEIALSREAIGDQIVELREQRRRLTSWRTYVGRFPIASLAASFAVGLFVAGARPERKAPRLIASSMFRWGMAAVKAGLLKEVIDIWARSGTTARPEQD